MKRPAAVPIGEILKTVFGEMDTQKNLFREDVESRWKEVAGESAAKHSRPIVLKKKILTVWVDSSGWMQELTMRKRSLLKGLKRMFGKDKISELHFKIGEF